MNQRRETLQVKTKYKFDNFPNKTIFKIYLFIRTKQRPYQFKMTI